MVGTVVSLYDLQLPSYLSSQDYFCCVVSPESVIFPSTNYYALIENLNVQDSIMVLGVIDGQSELIGCFILIIKAFTMHRLRT